MQKGKDYILRVAAKGLIVNDQGKFLILREAATYRDGTNVGRYHLPGGRITADEPFYDGLRREILEETGLEITPLQPLCVDEWWPTIRAIPHHVIAMFILCKVKTTKVTLSDEHDHYQWISLTESGAYDIMPPEDKVIEAYRRLK